jgi:tetratricopeptide (TPR) repeat protein
MQRKYFYLLICTLVAIFLLINWQNLQRIDFAEKEGTVVLGFVLILLLLFCLFYFVGLVIAVRFLIYPIYRCGCLGFLVKLAGPIYPAIYLDRIAEKFYLRKQYEEACKIYSEVVWLLPNEVNAILARGNMHLRLGRPEQALADFEKAIRFDPKSSQARICRIAFYLQQQQFDQIEPDIQACSADLLQHPSDFLTLGYACELYGYWERALDAYEHAILLEPANSEYLLQLARLRATCPLDSVRNGALALAHIEAVNRLQPAKDWIAESIFACTYAELEQFERAMEHARKSLELAPDDAKPERADRLKLYESRQKHRLAPKFVASAE